MKRKRECQKFFLMAGGSAHAEDAALGSRIQIRECYTCGEMFYAVPSSVWVEVEQEEHTAIQKCLRRSKGPVKAGEATA